MLKWWTIVPLIIFAGLALVLLRGLHQDPRVLPSALLNHAVPSFSLPSLNKGAKFTNQALQGHTSILHVFASWCLSCRAEHPIYMDIVHQTNVPIYGLAYKDASANLTPWLQHSGNPYKNVGLDSSGEVALQWGVYGTPETYIIDKQGIVRYRHVGPITHSIWRSEILPVLAHLRE